MAHSCCEPASWPAAQGSVRRHMETVANINVRVFRVIVVAAMALDALLSFYSHLPLAISQHLLWLPKELVINSATLTTLTSGVGLGALVPPNASVGLAIFCAYVVASIGLFFFRNWARWLFVFLALSGPVYAALSGMVVQTPFEALLGGLVGILDGAILALAFLSPIASLFNPINHPALR